VKIGKDMKKSYKLIAGLLILLIVVLGSVGCTREPSLRFEETRSLMDTYVKVIVYSDEETAETAINAAFARIGEIEKIATTWDSEGEAFKLNQDGYLDTPSDDLLKLINMSLNYYKLTEGSFDITVQPLLELWQGGLWKESKEVQQSKIDETLGLVGSDKIAIEDNRIYFQTEGMEITLGGIAKGYAVDEALEVLRDMGIKYALVDAGGDMGTINSKPDGELWNIALVNPDDTSQSLANFEFSDKSTGYSAPECISVTVIAGSCTEVDALSTSVFVMGPEDGMRLIESLDDVECFIVDADRTIHHSSGLSKYLVER